MSEFLWRRLCHSFALPPAACRSFGSSPPTSFPTTPQAPNHLPPPYTPPSQGTGVKKKEAMTAVAMNLRLTPKSGARGNHTCIPLLPGKHIMDLCLSWSRRWWRRSKAYISGVECQQLILLYFKSQGDRHHDCLPTFEAKPRFFSTVKA